MIRPIMKVVSMDDGKVMQFRRVKLCKNNQDRLTNYFIDPTEDIQAMDEVEQFIEAFKLFFEPMKAEGKYAEASFDKIDKGEFDMEELQFHLANFLQQFTTITTALLNYYATQKA